MKKFDSLNDLERRSKGSDVNVPSKQNIDKKRVIIVTSVAFAAIVALCVFLFGDRSRTTDQETTMSYEIEVDGQKYSADSLEELSTLVGFDVTYLFNNAPPVEKKTDVEDKLYSKGEVATIGTENGTYKFGVTDAKIMQRAALRGGETMYQITYTVENIDFDSGDGQGVYLFPEDLEVTDSDKNYCDYFSLSYDGENINVSDTTPPGKKTEKKAIYEVRNADSPYLQIYFPNRGVTCQVDIDNLSSYMDSHKTQQIDVGNTVKIMDTDGEMEITVDQIRIDNSIVYELQDNENIIVIDWDINNINYTPYGINDGINSYILEELFTVTDDQNYTVRSFGNIKGGSDGQYSLLDDVKIGNRGRIATVYQVSKECKSITIDFGNGSSLTKTLS